MIAVASAFGAAPVKGKMSAQRMTPDPSMAGYAEWDSWVFMSESTSGSKYYVKRSTTAHNGIDLWVKVEDKKLSECPTGLDFQTTPFLESPSAVAHQKAKILACERDRKEALGSTVMHLVLSCKTRKAKYLETAEYSQLGEPIRTDQGKNEWVAVIPDTVIDSVLTRMCAGQN